MAAFTGFDIFIYFKLLLVGVYDPVHDLPAVPAAPDTDAIFIISADQFARAWYWHGFYL
jgi:hypothetical protein